MPPALAPCFQPWALADEPQSPPLPQEPWPRSCPRALCLMHAHQVHCRPEPPYTTL